MVLTRSSRVTSSFSPGAAGRAASSDSTRSMHALSNHKQQQQQQLSVPTSMQQQQQRPSEFVVSPPLPPAAQAPGSPLFGAGEEKDEVRSRQRQMRSMGEREVEGLLSVALAGFGGSGEGFESNAREMQGKGEDYSALFNDLLSSNGLAHLITDAPIPAFSSSSSSSGYGLPSLPTTSTSTAAPPDPRAAHYALDAQLGSPLNLEFDGADGAAFSPLSPYGAASPVFSPPFSNEASPAWGGGDDWAGSPASFALNYNSNNSYASAGVSPALGELDLFGEYGGGGEMGGGGGEYSMSTSPSISHGFTAAPVGQQTTLVADVDGATSTGASYAAHTTMLPPLPFPASTSGAHQPLLFSPVIPAPPRAPPRLGTLTPVLSDNDDADVSPQLLPPPLPLPVPSPAPVKMEEEDVVKPSPATAPVVRRKPTATTAAAKDDSADSDYVPSSAGAKRPTRRVSTTTSRRASSPSTSTSTSASPAPAPSVPPPTGLKVALSAPITKRSYAVESRTSAKPIPKSLQKKMDAARRRGEEVDEQEYVEEATRKRKANTLSARESRAKKAQRVAELEELERRYVGEREGWEEERRELVERIEGLERELEEERERKRVRRE